MIHSKKELKFYIAADMMMNRGKLNWSIKDRLKHFIFPDYIMKYLKSMRYLQYYSDVHQITPPKKLLRTYHYWQYRRLGLKLGFSIGFQTLGYGVVIPHYGTIVIGNSNRIGNYAVLHTSICITDNGKKIGEAAYISSGVKMTSRIIIGDNVSVGANSLVNKNFPNNLMIAGAPAKVIKSCEAWYIRDGEEYHNKVLAVEALKKRMLNEN